MASICNACRYCEGYCAVFPALERRLEFGEGDLTYLANLCHNCGACYYACQYAPPHEFALNFPKMMAEIRGRVLPEVRVAGAARAGCSTRNGLVVDLVTATCVAALSAGIGRLHRSLGVRVARTRMARARSTRCCRTRRWSWTFGVAFVAAIAALVVGSVRFWRDIGEEPRHVPGAPVRSHSPSTTCCGSSTLTAAATAAPIPARIPRTRRKWFHQLTFYGFMLCFAATCVATLYHYVLGRHAPYPFLSLPVVLGTSGGIGLLIGPAGLLWLKRRRDPALASESRTGWMRRSSCLLFAVSLTGLVLLALRETRAMGVVARGAPRRGDGRCS